MRFIRTSDIPADRRPEAEFDASVWARQFIEAARLDPSLPSDFPAMRLWFARAIMAGQEWQHAIEETPDRVSS